jgi:hypothetical protein
MTPRDALWTIVVVFALVIAALVLHAHGVF